MQFHRIVVRFSHRVANQPSLTYCRSRLTHPAKWSHTRAAFAQVYFNIAAAATLPGHYCVHHTAGSNPRYNAAHLKNRPVSDATSADCYSFRFWMPSASSPLSNKPITTTQTKYRILRSASCFDSNIPSRTKQNQSSRSCLSPFLVLFSLSRSNLTLEPRKVCSDGNTIETCSLMPLKQVTLWRPRRSSATHMCYLWVTSNCDSPFRYASSSLTWVRDLSCPWTNGFQRAAMRSTG